MPAPRRFSRARLQEAALALVDAEGLDALSMRSLAAALGTGAMTLYNYVEGREGLEALLVEAVMAEAVCEGVPSDDWRADVRALARATWRSVRAHPDVIPLILTRRTFDEPTLLQGEALLDALARGGRTGRDLLVGLRVVTGYVMGFAQAELAGPLSAGRGESVAEITDRVRALPPERFPRLIDAAAAASGSDPGAEFEAGLDVVIAGLDAAPSA
ncbi:AcrR family transcriptional regulator [Streptomonospora nanhaiensis]|uniref:AcrR family transcriptional regulator n=1 Tax=Streptomonospora nanhaiensis TaxID=1323731 RepID=A0A853BRF4_9ACTN|nr:TetR/AcrR family transcriptional regulator C-terminal domain-containing protein [Streptomonospora nanhaiensis]NYI96932.1 AcrR family transcriptional regulator [Streptomonospora nanhaiensis]